MQQVRGVLVPDEPRKRTRGVSNEASAARVEPYAIEGAQSRRRRNTTAAPRTRLGPPVDFEAVKRRAADRTERVDRLKDEVQGGAYRADPLETARAMERRSDG
jgi:hypothetical protein